MVGTTDSVKPAPSRKSATGLSRRADSRALDPAGALGKRGAESKAGRLARASLALVTLAMLAASCIITDVPHFDEEEQTAPKLLNPSANPDPREILVIRSEDVSKTFSAQVESANDLDQVIGVRLYVDYGVPSSSGPWQFSYSFAPVAEETTPNEPRLATATWTQGPPVVLEGCHTFTLMVSHRFDDATGCPEELADSDEITWVAFICAPGTTCDTSALDPANDCPKPACICPAVADEVDPDDPGACRP